MARSRRSALRRITVVSAVVAGLMALRERKLSENQQRFNLP